MSFHSQLAGPIGWLWSFRDVSKMGRPESSPQVGNSFNFGTNSYAEVAKVCYILKKFRFIVIVLIEKSGTWYEINKGTRGQTQLSFQVVYWGINNFLFASLVRAMINPLIKALRRPSIGWKFQLGAMEHLLFNCLLQINPIQKTL